MSKKGTTIVYYYISYPIYVQGLSSSNLETEEVLVTKSEIYYYYYIYEYIMHQSNTTNVNTLFYYLGQHVSTLIESSSGPSKIQILTNNV